MKATGGNPKPLLKCWRKIKLGYVNITTGKRPNYLILSGKELDGWVNIVLSEKSDQPELLLWVPRFQHLVEAFLNELPPEWQQKIVGLRDHLRRTKVGLTLCINISANPDAPLTEVLKEWNSFCKKHPEYLPCRFLLVSTPRIGTSGKRRVK